MIHPLIVAFRRGWRNRRDPRGDMLLGLGVAFLMLYIHALYEWVFFTFLIQYVFVIGWGMVAGTAIQLGYWRPSIEQSPDRSEPVRALEAQINRLDGYCCRAALQGGCNTLNLG